MEMKIAIYLMKSLEELTCFALLKCQKSVCQKHFMTFVASRNKIS